MTYPATWSALVSAVSDDVVARLAAANMPPLALGPNGEVGKIFMGPEFLSQQKAPPSIVMVPRGFRMGPRSVASRSNGAAALELATELSDRSIRTQWKKFDVHVWNCNFADQVTASPDPVLDWDAVDALYSILWQSVHSLAAGIWNTSTGTIDRDASRLQRVGRYAIFDLEIATPVLDVSLPFAPTNVAPRPTTLMQPLMGGAGPEIGCQQ